jgi:hypothetical protein
MFNPLVGWQREWFFLHNNVDTLLPMFMGNRPVPQPSWGYGVARRDTHKLQPMRDGFRQLLQAGLTGADLHQLPHLATPAAGIYTVDVPGPGCSGSCFSAELDNAEIDTRVWRILALGAHRNSVPSSIPLRERVARPWLSPLELASTRLCQFLSFLLHLLCLCAGSWVCAQRPTRVTLHGEFGKAGGQLY